MSQRIPQTNHLNQDKKLDNIEEMPIDGEVVMDHPFMSEDPFSSVRTKSHTMNQNFDYEQFRLFKELKDGKRPPSQSGKKDGANKKKSE